MPSSRSSNPAQSLESKKTASVVTSRVSPLLSPAFYFLGRYALLPVYFRHIEVIGRENLPASGPLLLAPTHRSRWDAFMVPYAAGRDITGRDLHFMVSGNEVQGIQGWFIRRFGGFAINTDRPEIAVLRHGVELLQSGKTLVIFPEGNIFRDRQIQPLKPGFARLALQAASSKGDLGLKIVPMAIHYSQPFPQWGCRVKIALGKPLDVAQYLGEPPKKAAQQLTTEVEAALTTLMETHAPPLAVLPEAVDPQPPSA